MIRAALLLALALIFALPAMVQAQMTAPAPVTIVDAPRALEVLPANQIIIRNASGSRLNFWLSIDGAAWAPFFAEPGKAALIRRPDVRAAIATSVTEADVALTARAPEKPPADIDGGYHVAPPYFFARLSGGSRAQFCWSPSETRWRIQKFGESYCD